MTAASLYARCLRLWRQEIRSLLILTVTLFALRSSLADWSDVPTGSMKPTILEGDRVYVNKLAYDLKVPFTTRHLAEWSNPRRGDIVVFFSPYDGKRLVKRMVGLPGDTLELRHNCLFINGEPASYKPLGQEALRDVSPADLETKLFGAEQLGDRSHALAATPGRRAMRDFGPCVVPEGSYFMMGDNRDDSFDSRYYGPVERKRIVGRATAVAMSFDRSHWWVPRWRRFFTPLDHPA
ncbi:MAG TPA: signal peptidase I [Candidatus Acidoferrum sp.]|nr:signal peptidase I [Candidatus Acidoferrum sp.]